MPAQAKTFLVRSGSPPRAAASPRKASGIVMLKESPDSEEPSLEAFERECINIFVHAAQALSIPRSIGEIYGLLYASPEPLPMETIVGRLQISKGSASQGLRWLRDVNAVRSVYVTGDRRDHFTAETELRRLALGYLRESVEPQLSRADDYLNRVGGAVPSPKRSEAGRFAEARFRKLRRWHRFAAQILPLILKVSQKL